MTTTPIYSWTFATDGTETIHGNMAVDVAPVGLRAAGVVATAADTQISNGSSGWALSFSYTPSFHDWNGMNPGGGDSYFLTMGTYPGAAGQSIDIGMASGQWLVVNGSGGPYYSAFNPNQTYGLVYYYNGDGTLSLTVDGGSPQTASYAMAITLDGTIAFGGLPGGARNASGILSNVIYSIHGLALAGNSATASDALFPVSDAAFRMEFDFIASTSDIGGSGAIPWCIGPPNAGQVFEFVIGGGTWSLSNGSTSLPIGTADATKHHFVITYATGGNISVTIDGGSPITGTLDLSGLTLTGTIIFGAFSGGGYGSSSQISGWQLFDGSNTLLYDFPFDTDGREIANGNNATVTAGSFVSTNLYDWPFLTDGSETISGNNATVTGSFTTTPFVGGMLQLNSTVAVASDSLIVTGDAAFELGFDITTSAGDLASGGVVPFSFGTNTAGESFDFVVGSGAWYIFNGSSQQSISSGDTSPHTFVMDYAGSSSLTVTIDGGSPIPITIDFSTLTSGGSWVFGSYLNGNNQSTSALANVYLDSIGTPPPSNNGNFFMVM